MSLRAAVREDARLLARLIDIAGEGIPSWLWSQGAAPGQSPLDYGTERACRETGGFSYRNATVAEFRGTPVGMMLGYVIPEPSDEERREVASLPAPIRPFVELEHRAVGTFYVNAVAVLPDRRGLGIGAKLLRAAEASARHAEAPETSIQVYSQNAGAVRLYERFGFRIVDRTPVILHPCPPHHDEDVLLMTKSVLA
ncbi:acetyltransferase, GNAT family protein [Lutibaculum baratangense AMV1]|uniref:Acetyltransferase, GNAT family protein n=1 Tax=Lutibaculum baratangense AMV1 TaxID=631454 RepID=V4QTZ3_9HYPH|nr:acetyltransferase, GNAT family protein [Lutibaculum baratangense AMV1]